MQWGHGNFPSASFAGIVALFVEPVPVALTGGRPGALGSTPLRPCEPTTCVGVSGSGIKFCKPYPEDIAGCNGCIPCCGCKGGAEVIGRIGTSRFDGAEEGAIACGRDTVAELGGIIDGAAL